MPEVVEWESFLGQKFVVERSLDDIANKLVTPEKEETVEKDPTERDATQSVVEDSKSHAASAAAHDSAAEE